MWWHYLAAGTVGMVHMGLGLRLGLMAQYMPLEQYNVHLNFPRIVLDDVTLEDMTRAHGG